jgi:HAMP domain-containing protein
MSHLLHNHPGLVAIFVLIVLAFFAVVLAIAFGWARQRAERLEHTQRSVNAIRWPGSNPAPHHRKPVPPPNPPRRTVRVELGKAPR